MSADETDQSPEGTAESQEPQRPARRRLVVHDHRRDGRRHSWNGRRAVTLKPPAGPEPALSDAASPYRADRSPMKRMKQMARDHEDVLQNIEFVLVNSHRQDPEIDDRVTDQALRACLSGADPAGLEPPVPDLIAALTSFRQVREDVSEEVWREGLRVVQESVRRHSQFRPGETSYLDFAGQYIR